MKKAGGHIYKDKLLSELHRWRKSINDNSVTQEFREGEWKEFYELWKSWVFREPGEKIDHPFSKKVH